MNRDDIIKMARQAGCVEDKHYKGEVIFISNDALERFFDMAQAAERSNWPAEMEAMERQVNILTDELAKAVTLERAACAEIEKEIMLSPAFFATLDEYHAHRDAVLAYRNLIWARDKHEN